MDCAKKVLVAICLSVTLLASATVARAQNASLREQISEHEQKLSEACAAQRTKEEGTQLIALGISTGNRERCKRRWIA